MSRVQEENCFHVIDPDYSLSPHTGMTRKHWVDAAEYLLGGAFSHIHSLDDCMRFPKQEGKSYPLEPGQIPVEKLEGLCRTLLTAAPLLKEKPGLLLKGIPVAKYYQNQILKILDSNSDSHIPRRTANEGPNQVLVEFGTLAISLFIIPEILWDVLTEKQQDMLAAFLLSYGEGPTIPSNWVFFNIFILSFFKSRGYRINEPLLKRYLKKALKRYCGEGWYNDGPAYDYYSMWSFQLYGILWSHYFGKEHHPGVARKFIRNFQDLNSMYPYLFSKSGRMMMYGRSISYRFASVSPFPFTSLYGNNETNHGWLRRISSGVLLQFLQHPGLLKDGIPTLGFYDAFEPAVQNYNCRGSVFWMGKAFLGLLLPEESPFWTETENDGPWEDYGIGIVRNLYSVSTNILISNYPESGASEIRAWCHEKIADDWQEFRSTENYNRLAYNSLFPWQADGPTGETAMNYAFMIRGGKWEVFRLYTFRKFCNGYYQREAVLETDEEVRMILTDYPFPAGILRVDRNVGNKEVRMRLGHYGLPVFGTGLKVEKRSFGEFQAAIIDNGLYQLAMVVLCGWETLDVLDMEGVHPESRQSALLEAGGFFSNGTPGVFATLQLWKESGAPWSDEDLFPVSRINIGSGVKNVDIVFFDGQKKTVKF